MPGHSGRGHRPCHSARLILDRPGAQSPRPAPAPPLAGASRPPGRALASVSPGPAALRGTVAQGRGKRGAFPDPARTGDGTDPASMAGAIAPAAAPRRDQDRPGAQSPRPAPAPPMAGASHPPGRTLASVSPGPAVLLGTVPSGRGKRDAFPVPARTGGPVDSKTPRINGRGHRLCHSAAPGSGPAGGPKPPASARPAPGGRFAPAGSGACLCHSRTGRSTGHRSARAGETRVAFPDPARNGEGTITAAMAGAIAPAKSLHWHQDQPGAKAPGQRPPLAGASPPPGRALASGVPGPAGPQGAVARGRGKRGSRFLFPPGLTKALSPLPWQGPSPLPQRHADPWPAWGQSPPASARPATGGRWTLLTRAGETRVAFPAPAGGYPLPRTGKISASDRRSDCLSSATFQ